MTVDVEVGDRVRVSYESVQTDGPVEREAEVMGPADPSDGNVLWLEDDDGISLTVRLDNVVTVSQSGSTYGSSRLLGRDPTVEVLGR